MRSLSDPGQVSTDAGYWRARPLQNTNTARHEYTHLSTGRDAEPEPPTPEFGPVVASNGFLSPVLGSVFACWSGRFMTSTGSREMFFDVAWEFTGNPFRKWKRNPGEPPTQFTIPPSFCAKDAEFVSFCIQSDVCDEGGGRPAS